MIGAVKRAIDRMRGYGDADVTVPVMDGRLKPNQKLDQAAVVASVPEPDHLLVQGDTVLCSSGKHLLALGQGTTRDGVVQRMEMPSLITAVAAAEDGGLAIATEGQGIAFHGGAHDGLTLPLEQGPNRRCITDLLFLEAGILIIAEGSSLHSYSDWKRDLMTRSATGGLWLADLVAKSVRRLAGDLAFPYGLARLTRESILVTESWEHRVIAVDIHLPFTPKPVLPDLPAYPARIVPDARGGFWLSLFAPRNEIIEFVLRQPAYRERMIREVPVDYWVAPKLNSGSSFLEPLQGGGVKQMGILKPWAPSISYGLVARFDPGGAIIESLHSRADGRRHGTTSCVKLGSALYVASKGSNCVVKASVNPGEVRS